MGNSTFKVAFVALLLLFSLATEMYFLAGQTADPPLAFGMGSMGPVIAVSQRSGRSDTQTITIPPS